MSTLLTGLIAAVVIYFLFRFIVAGRNKPEEPVIYICDECGENECVCRREDEAPKQ